MTYDQLDKNTQLVHDYVTLMIKAPEVFDFIAGDPFTVGECHIYPKENSVYGPLRVFKSEIHPQMWAYIFKIAKEQGIPRIKLNFVEIKDGILTLSHIRKHTKRITPHEKRMIINKLHPMAFIQAVLSAQVDSYNKRQDLLTVQFAVIRKKKYEELLKTEALYKELIEKEKQ